MLLQEKIQKSGSNEITTPPKVALFCSGILLGLLAGVTGIGGGIYLAPVMHLMHWARPQTTAACTSLFIALNSLAGLAGQLTKGTSALDSLPLVLIIACPIAVLLGGRIGTFLLTNKLPNERIRKITAAVILLVAFRLWLKTTIG